MRESVLAKKQSTVEEIKGNIEKAHSIVLVDYRGLTVEQVTQLRKNYREAGVVYKVYKNTMMNRAFRESGMEEILEMLEGTNAVAFAMEDAVSAARVSNDFAKENEKLEIRAGYLAKEFLDVKGVKELASIPPREVLIAKLLGSLKSPMNNLAYLLSAIIKKKEESGETATESATEAPKEEPVEEEAAAEANEEVKAEEAPETADAKPEE